jgi:hypothetical protein
MAERYILVVIMFPDTPHNQSAPQTALPPIVPHQPQPPTSPAAAPVAQQMSEAKPAMTAQARQLMEQYKNDPYHLSEALQQLKSTYLAQQYGIAPNLVEN